MFRVDTREIAQYEDDLKEFAAKAFPFATRKTINDGAFAGQRIARADIGRIMTLRNTFTVLEGSSATQCESASE